MRVHAVKTSICFTGLGMLSALMAALLKVVCANAIEADDGAARSQGEKGGLALVIDATSRA